jgi:hypothetical protein
MREVCLSVIKVLWNFQEPMHEERNFSSSSKSSRNGTEPTSTFSIFEYRVAAFTGGSGKARRLLRLIFVLEVLERRFILKRTVYTTYLLYSTK